MIESAVAPPPVEIADRRVRVVFPSWRDPRIHVASALLTVQVIGQVALDFELSIAQLLASLLTCAVLEIAITLWRQRVLAWPASALLTGNGVALILRVEGTEHGDWWSTRGLWIFCVVAGASLLTKYLVRVDGRPLFNPSNIGLVVAFLLLGSDMVNPLDFWLGPLSPGLVAAYVVIVGVGVVVTARLRLLAIAVAFWTTFAAALGLVAAAGHCMTARWSLDPVCGWTFWEKVVTAPEILVFAFFMITDPRTVPIGRRARLLFGGSVGFLAAALVATQRTEFGAKVAVLAALVVVCAARPLIERLVRDGDGVAVPRPRVPAVAALVAIGALALLAAGIPARPGAPASIALADSTDLTLDVPPVPVVIRDRSVDSITDAISGDDVQRITEDVARELASVSGGGDYVFDSMTVRVIRRPVPQSPPRLAVHVVGRLDGAPLDSLFTVSRAGERYVITAELEP